MGTVRVSVSLEVCAYVLVSCVCVCWCCGYKGVDVKACPLAFCDYLYGPLFISKCIFVLGACLPLHDHPV